MTPGHLSYLALDGIRLGRVPEPGERDHLAACPVCAGYLQVAADAPPMRAPTWLAQPALGPPVRAHRGSPGDTLRARLWPWLLPLAPVAAALVLVLLPRLGGSPKAPSTRSAASGTSEVTRAKGSDQPGLRLFVKRGNRVFPWDGNSFLRPEDRLRLEVRRAVYRHVSVAFLPPVRDPVVLYQGALQDQHALLPVSFRVDDQGDEEVLSIILDRDPIEPWRHETVGTPAGEAHTWREILVLKKQAITRQVTDDPLQGLKLD